MIEPRINAEYRIHSGAINSVLQIDDDLIASCSDDASIKIWNLKTNSMVASLDEHFARVTCLIQIPFPDNRIASGSFDTSIRLWDLQTKKCTLQLCEHDGWILDMIILKDKRLASCSGDKTIKIWSINKGVSDFTLTGHKGYVNQIIQSKVNENQIISASEDKTIKIWDIILKSCINTITFENEINFVTEIISDNKSSFLLGQGNYIRLLKDYKEVKVLQNDVFISSSFCVLNKSNESNLIIYGCEEGYIQLLDLERMELKGKFSIHDDNINKIIVMNNKGNKNTNETVLISCGNDSLVKLFTI